MGQYCAAGELRKEMGHPQPRCEGCECSRIDMPKLKCECGSDSTKVIETRAYEEVIYRIRECNLCKERYLTEEKIVSKRRSW